MQRLKHCPNFKSYKLSSFSKISVLTAVLLSNAVFAESYQSFSSLGYSQSSSSYKEPIFIYSQSSALYEQSLSSYESKWESDSLSLFSQYFFEEQQALGPLNEFDYINSSSNLYANVSNSNTESFTSRSDADVSWEGSSNAVNIGGQWITHGFLLGAGYNYTKYNNVIESHSIDNSDDSYSASLGYFLGDDLVIRADYSDGGYRDDYFSYSASYNLQLAGTDYIGFTYNVDEDFDIHHLSSRYFLALTQESYLVLGGDYTFDSRDEIYNDDSWSINSSYYFNTRTSVSAFYGKDDGFTEGNIYGIAVSYFIDDNYSIQAAYNANDNDKFEVDREGYSVSFSAQF